MSKTEQEGTYDQPKYPITDFHTGVVILYAILGAGCAKRGKQGKHRYQ